MTINYPAAFHGYEEEMRYRESRLLKEHEAMARYYDQMQMQKQCLNQSAGHGSAPIKQAPVMPTKNKKVLLCK